MKLVNLCPVFVSPNVKTTVEFYVKKLGFTYADHIDKIDQFATIYRDSIEFVIVQAKFGVVENNLQRYGNGYDAYIDPDAVESVDVFYSECVNQGVEIESKPIYTDYGSYEFVFIDIDGRRIGVGLICDNKRFFSNSNYLRP